VVFLDVLVPSIKDWALWYLKYLPKPVFKEEGTIRGQSVLFQTYFQYGDVDWITSCNRYANYRLEEIENESFKLFCTLEKYPTFNSYRMCHPSWEAGFRSCAKYDRPQPLVNEVAWNLAGKWTMSHFKPVMGGSKIMSKDEALTGMNMQSSAGFPWNLMYHNKKDFLESDASRVVDDYWDLIGSENSQHIVPIWTSTVKAELRPIVKLKRYGAEYDRLRTFTASAAEHSINCNRMYVHQNEKFYAGFDKIWSFVGGTKFLRGWDRLYRRLNRHKRGFALDETAYDASLFRKALYGVRDMRWDMLDPEYRTQENWLRHCALYESIINSAIVLETGEIVLKHTGNPSGSANTIVDNTLILFRLLAYAYILLAEEAECTELITYSSFMQLVEAALYGDDNTFTVCETIIQWFNAINICRIWFDIGVVTSTDCWEPRETIKLDFLSHDFVEVDGVILPSPRTEKVLSSLMYGSKLNDVRWHLMRALALRLDSWANRECAIIIERYINFLFQKFPDILLGNSSIELRKGIVVSMSQIRTLNKSDLELKRLYMNPESAGIDIESVDSLFKNLHYCVDSKSYNFYSSSIHYNILNVY